MHRHVVHRDLFVLLILVVLDLSACTEYRGGALDARTVRPDSAVVVSAREAPGSALSGIRGMAAISDSVIAVTHVSEPFIRIFRTSGELLTAFGNKGEGPGELRTPSRIGWADDYLWVTDRNDRIAVFNMSGEVTADIRLASQLLRENWEVFGLLGTRGLVVFRNVYSIGRERGAIIRRDSPHVGVVTLLSWRDSTMWGVVDTGSASVRLISRSALAGEPVRFELDNRTIQFPQLYQHWPRVAVMPGSKSAVLLEDSMPRIGAASLRARWFTADTEGANTVILIPRTALTMSAADKAVEAVLSAFLRRYYANTSVPSRVLPAVKEQVTSRLLIPEFLPLIGEVMVGPDTSIWLKPVWSSNIWKRIRRDIHVSTVQFPDSVQIMSMSRNYAWGVTHDSLGIPRIIGYFVGRARK